VCGCVWVGVWVCGCTCGDGHGFKVVGQGRDQPQAQTPLRARAYTAAPALLLWRCQLTVSRLSPSLRSARTYIGAELVWAQLSWGRRRPCSALCRPVPVADCTCPSLHVRRAEHTRPCVFSHGVCIKGGVHRAPLGPP